jgi:hypothetical protein
MQTQNRKQQKSWMVSYNIFHTDRCAVYTWDYKYWIFVNHNIEEICKTRDYTYIVL